MADWGRIGSRGNVQDRRGMAPVAFGGLGLTGLAFMMLFTVLTGGDFTDVINQLPAVQVDQQHNINAEEFQGEDTYEVFASTVLGSNNDLWESLFAKSGKTYEEPTLALFRSATQSLCGNASSAVGPHYCPIDQTIYLDETFFDQLVAQFGAQGGDVAEAYVISHEVGHHAQNMLGIMGEVQSTQQQNPDQANDLSVQLELQADCFAGLWAHSIKDQNVFSPGEIQEAMDAASTVGDDRIQERVQGYVNPESWTHGSSAQRKEWFTKGYESGELSACNAFQ